MLARQRRERHTAAGKALELRIEERREKVLKLRRQGFSVREIAKQLQADGHHGTSPAQVQRDLDEVLARTVESADAYAAQERQVSLVRIEGALKAIAPQVEAGDQGAIDRLIRLEARRAALLGLDAPTRTELTGAAGAPVSIDARTDILGRLAGLAAGGAPPAGAGTIPPGSKP